jgi:hypothetical protein
MAASRFRREAAARLMGPDQNYRPRPAKTKPRYHGGLFLISGYAADTDARSTAISPPQV